MTLLYQMMNFVNKYMNILHLVIKNMSFIVRFRPGMRAVMLFNCSCSWPGKKWHRHSRLTPLRSVMRTTRFYFRRITGLHEYSIFIRQYLKALRVRLVCAWFAFSGLQRSLRMPFHGGDINDLRPMYTLMI